VCRAVGVPTRYVSGYLVTRRSRSAQGSSASHAWVEVLIPQMGWCAFDPTNNMLANDYYIKLAAGCDYRDVPPTRGIYKGFGVTAQMRVRVHTIVEGESLEAGDQAENDDAPTLGNDTDASTQRAPHELVG
jgi:transglutaminase-like putative cysteine protease